jgi:hypothetical protein
MLAFLLDMQHFNFQFWKCKWNCCVLRSHKIKHHVPGRNICTLQNARYLLGLLRSMSVREISQCTDCCTMVRSDISNIPTETLHPVNTIIKGDLKKNNDMKSSFIISLLTTNYWGDQSGKCAAYVTHDGEVHAVFCFENLKKTTARKARK